MSGCNCFLLEILLRLPAGIEDQTTAVSLWVTHAFTIRVRYSLCLLEWVRGYLQNSICSWGQNSVVELAQPAGSPGSHPQYHIHRHYNSSTEGVEAGGSRFHSHRCLYKSQRPAWVVRDFAIRKKGRERGERVQFSNHCFNVLEVLKGQRDIIQPQRLHCCCVDQRQNQNIKISCTCLGHLWPTGTKTYLQVVNFILFLFLRESSIMQSQLALQRFGMFYQYSLLIFLSLMFLLKQRISNHQISTWQVWRQWVERTALP